MDDICKCDAPLPEAVLNKRRDGKRNCTVRFYTSTKPSIRRTLHAWCFQKYSHVSVTNGLNELEIFPGGVSKWLHRDAEWPGKLICAREIDITDFVDQEMLWDITHSNTFVGLPLSRWTQLKMIVWGFMWAGNKAIERPPKPWPVDCVILVKRYISSVTKNRQIEGMLSHRIDLPDELEAALDRLKRD